MVHERLKLAFASPEGGCSATELVECVLLLLGEIGRHSGIALLASMASRPRARRRCKMSSMLSKQAEPARARREPLAGAELKLTLDATLRWRTFVHKSTQENLVLHAR